MGTGCHLGGCSGFSNMANKAVCPLPTCRRGAITEGGGPLKEEAVTDESRLCWAERTEQEDQLGEVIA